jgi:hypothetical protein
MLEYLVGVKLPGVRRARVVVGYGGPYLNYEARIKHCKAPGIVAVSVTDDEPYPSPVFLSRSGHTYDVSGRRLNVRWQPDNFVMPEWHQGTIPY